MTITPEQFNKIALKEDVRVIVQEELAPMKKDVAKIMTTLDAMNKTLTDCETEDTAHTSSHGRIQTTLDNHEERITVLEKVSTPRAVT